MTRSEDSDRSTGENRDNGGEDAVAEFFMLLVAFGECWIACLGSWPPIECLGDEISLRPAVFDRIENSRRENGALLLFISSPQSGIAPESVSEPQQLVMLF